MKGKFGHWVRDYAHALRGLGRSFLYRKPPRHYLGYVREDKSPVILIPGLYSRWPFLKFLADPLSRAGHPVYVLPRLGYHASEIPRAAEIVRELIDAHHLEKVIILAHSKGGLVGKYVLAFLNRDRRVKKLIAIASPFGGSHAVRFFPLKPLRELYPSSPVVNMLREQSGANHHITSIFGLFDNHVWPQESCRLEGAKNIQVDVHGHHKILFDHKVRDIVLREVELTDPNQKRNKNYYDRRV